MVNMYILLFIFFDMRRRLKYSKTTGEVILDDFMYKLLILCIVILLLIDILIYTINIDNT